MKNRIIYLFFFFCAAEPMLSQTLRDKLILSSDIKKNEVSSSFNRMLNTSNFNGKLIYGFNYDKFNFSIHENFKSTVIESQPNNIKDEQFLFLTALYKYLPNLDFGIALNNSLYSGDKRLAINRAAYFNSIVFLKYIPFRKIELTPFAGPATNEQVGTKDKGFIYGIEGEINSLKFNNIRVNSSAKFQNEDIAPRKNLVRFFDLKLHSKAKDIYNNTVEFNFSQLKKDFYLEADSLIVSEFNVNNNIQSRNEINYIIEDKLSVPRTSSPFDFNFSGIVSNRKIDRDIRYKSFSNLTTSSFDTRIEELKLKLQTQTNYYSDFINGNIKVGYAQREENHIAKPLDGANQIIFEKKKTLEEQKSNRSQIISISASGTIFISPKNNILFSLFHRKFIYDTPSEENFDDRDELLSIARIRVNHTFNSFFKMFINLDASLNHIAYIFAERSANNNKNRSIKFSGGGTFRGKNFTTNNIAEVSANYTTYDFENKIPTQKSFAFRQVAFKDSSTIRIKNNLYFNTYGYIKLSEQGDFNWENFSGKPLRFLREIYLEPKFTVPIHELILGIGLRYFSLSTFGYTLKNERVRQSNYTSIGPLAELKYILLNSLNINMHGYYEFISPENNILVQRANLYLAVNWVF